MSAKRQNMISIRVDSSFDVCVLCENQIVVDGVLFLLISPPIMYLTQVYVFDSGLNLMSSITAVVVVSLLPLSCSNDYRPG